MLNLDHDRNKEKNAMIKDIEAEKKKLNILKAATYFLSHDESSIDEVAAATGISSSSVQRYLNDPLVNDFRADFGIDDPHELIRSLLNRNKQRGLSKGGKTYASNNIPTKDEIGKFTGSRKK